MRMSADDPQACCADDSCKSLGDIESLSVGVGRQLFLSDFETMLPQLGVTDSDSISRLFKLLDQDATGQVNEPFARTAFSLLAVDDAAEGQIEVNYTGKWFLRSENEIRDEVISHLTEHKTTDDFSDGDSNGESGMRVTSRGAVSFISAADLKQMRC